MNTIFYGYTSDMTDLPSEWLDEFKVTGLWKKEDCFPVGIIAGAFAWMDEEALMLSGALPSEL